MAMVAPICSTSTTAVSSTEFEFYRFPIGFIGTCNVVGCGSYLTASYDFIPTYLIKSQKLPGIVITSSIGTPPVREDLTRIPHDSAGSARAMGHRNGLLVGPADPWHDS